MDDNGKELIDDYKGIASHSASPDQFLSLQKRSVLFGVLTFIILALLTGILVYQRYLINRENKQASTREFVVSVKAKIQETLAQSASATKLLSFVIQEDGQVNGFDSIASMVLMANPGIDALQLVPGGVIRYVYPMQGNEKVIGYDVLNDPERNKEAKKAIQKKELFFAGPFTLKQNGLGIVGRLPVYRQGKFWGFSAVIIKMSTLEKAVGIDTTGASGFYVRLSKINPDTGKEEFFIGPQEGSKNDDHVSVNVPNGEWKLSAAPLNKKSAYTDILWLGSIGLLFAGTCGVFVYTVVIRPRKLDALVKERTAELQDSEERYRSLIEQAPDGIIVYDFDGTIHQFNRRAYIESGYTKEEFARLNLKDLLSEKKMTMRQSTSEAIQAGKTAMMERRFHRKDGTLMDIEINVSMLPDANLLAYIRNATDRKNAEKALKESEEKFSRVFQSDMIALSITNEQGNIIDVNESFVRMIGSTKEDIVGKTSAEAGLLNKVTKARREVVYKAVNNQLEQHGRIKNYELEIEKPDGSWGFVLLSVETFMFRDQPHWLTLALDITEKKRAELSLLESELKYRSLIEQASDGIIISDLRGNILEVNKSICNMAGYSGEEMLGKSITEFMPKEDIVMNPLRIEELLRGRSLLYERRLQKKNGELLDVEVNSRMASRSTLIGFIRDITERKNSAESLKISNDRFELIARATNDAIWQHDFAKNETTGNDNLYNLYGFKRGVDKIRYETFIERVHPAERETLVNNLLDTIAQKGSSIAEDFQFMTAEGTYKNIYDRAYITYDKDGKPAKIMGVMQDITSRVNSEKAIRKEKDLSDSIINSLPGIFYLYTTECRFLRWNKRFESVTGYSGDEIRDMHPLSLFDEDEKPLIESKIRNVFESGSDHVEALFMSKDKHKTPYYFSAIRVMYQDQLCLLGFGLDFTDKERARLALLNSEEKFRSLVEQASDGVVIMTPEGRTLYMSPAVERITGYTQQELTNMNLYDLVHLHDRSTVNQQVEQAMQNPGSPVKLRLFRALHKNGTWRWLENTTTNMMHIAAVNGLVQNFRDITEKLETEKNIITEKDLSDSIINSLPGIFYLYEASGKFIRWNRNFETVTGYSAEEIKNMHPPDFYEEPEKDRFGQHIKDGITGEVPGLELLLCTKDNRKIPFFYNSLSIDYKGIPTILVMGFDVTERKKIEQELLQSHENLERKASELISSYNELERFAYIVSHDLQEPLRMVSSFLKLLEKKYKPLLDETGEKYIHFAVDGADRMKKLIMDLLEYSRTGTNKDVPADTDMNDVMADVLDVLKNTIEEEQAGISVEKLPILPNTSKLQMFQLMQNLVGNAIKYHGESKPLIKISASEEEDQWLFSISDNGIGIDPQNSEKIFIVFQRLHNKSEYSGTGIGLSICKKIVEKHGGRIWVESSPGVGSTFYFTIQKS